MKSIVFFVICSTFYTSQASPPIDSNRVKRIVGGKVISIDDAPHMVSIQIGGLHNCGGSIVSPYFVLTAGHCVNEISNQYTIRSGSTYNTKNGTIHRVFDFVKHGSADIALILVVDPFEFDNVTCMPIEMFEPGEKSDVGTWGVLTGWGSESMDLLDRLADRLRSVSLPIVDWGTCARMYLKTKKPLKKGEICAGFCGKNLKYGLDGDSGGPLTIGGRLAGVFERIFHTKKEVMSISTQVAPYRDWISEASKFLIKCWKTKDCAKKP